jgi:hypothetical protein
LSKRLGKTSVGFLMLVAGLCAAPALAQDFSAGKTAAQLFASDCSACHKSPGGLAKGQSVSALTSFLREHYTTKTESAAILAAYLSGAGPGNAKLSPQAPMTGSKANEEKPAPKPRPAATATAAEPEKRPEAAASAPATQREAARPAVDPVVTKLNSYAGARGEPKDTARLATPGNKVESYANSGAEGVTPTDEPNAKRKPADKRKRDTNATGDAGAPHPPRPRRAQAPVVPPPPGNN